MLHDSNSREAGDCLRLPEEVPFTSEYFRWQSLTEFWDGKYFVSEWRVFWSGKVLP